MEEPKFDLDVVLSLFDGISCGQEALKKAGLTTRIFLSSEIDKYPKQVTRKNHPLTVQLGDVTQVVADDLPHVNLLMGGSPCQGFSFAGKQLNFDDPRSALFFEFARLLKECKPDYFLLENVVMKKEFQDVISEHVGVEPILLNSSLVSAQSRKRLYWTNIPGLTQPKDKGILLKDILENGIADSVKNRATETHKENIDKAHCLLARDYKGFGNQPMTGVRDAPLSQPNEILYEEPYVKLNGKESGCVGYVGNSPKQATKIYSVDGKSQCLTANGGGQGGKTGLYQIPTKPKVLIVPEQVRVRKHEVDIEGLQHCLLNALENSNKTKKQVAEELNDKFSTVEHYFRKVGSEYFCIPSEQHWFPLKKILNIKTDEFDAPITEFEVRDGKYDMADRVYSPDHKAPTVLASTVAKVLTSPTYRKLTPIECERLQTLPDNYTEGLSNSQRLRALGNGWTVDMIVHIFQGLKKQIKGEAA